MAAGHALALLALASVLLAIGVADAAVTKGAQLGDCTAYPISMPVCHSFCQTISHCLAGLLVDASTHR